MILFYRALIGSWTLWEAVDRAEFLSQSVDNGEKQISELHVQLDAAAVLLSILQPTSRDAAIPYCTPFCLLAPTEPSTR